MARMAVNLNTGLVTGLGCHSATLGLGFMVLSLGYRVYGIGFIFSCWACLHPACVTKACNNRPRGDTHDHKGFSSTATL